VIDAFAPFAIGHVLGPSFDFPGAICFLALGALGIVPDHSLLAFQVFPFGSFQALGGLEFIPLEPGLIFRRLLGRVILWRDRNRRGLAIQLI